MAADSSPTVVRFEDVSLAYEETRALDHVSFAVSAGETRIVLGAAGSGKTVLLKTVVGLTRPDSGHVYLFDEEVTNRKESGMYGIRSRVGILFQEGALFDSLTIEENVGYPLSNQQALHHKEGHQVEIDPAEIARRVSESLNFVGLEHTLEKFPSELSGGMRRRVGIARAIVTAPPLVLYDSPTAGLDPITANRIIHLIIKQRDLQNTAAILVTHRYQDGHMMANFRYNPNSGAVEAVRHTQGSGGVRESQMTTKFFVMNEGRLVFEGSETELLASADPYVQKFARPGSS